VCSANLFAANKKEAGSFRPIAVGEVLRRLTAKCLAFVLAPLLAPHLKPHQLGVGTKSGCKAILHATQSLLNDTTIPSNKKWILQVDYVNAFNCMDRTHTFREVREHAPGLAAFVEWCYGSHSLLFFGSKDVLLSRTGYHQGDPLGPLLFAVGIHPIILKLLEQVPDLILVAWYLDDGLVAGRPPDVLKAFHILQELCPGIGL
jgi:hypothetical protein